MQPISEVIVDLDNRDVYGPFWSAESAMDWLQVVWWGRYKDAFGAPKEVPWDHVNFWAWLEVNFHMVRMILRGTEP